MASNTAILGLPKPTLGDAADEEHAVGALADALDVLVPNSSQKAALAGSSGAPSGTNKYVTSNDVRLTDVRPPGVGSIFDASVADAADIQAHKIAGTAVVSNDPRLSDARAPLNHGGNHQPGGVDDIGVVPIGGQIIYAGQLLPSGSKWAFADGGLIDRTTFATFFNRAGHAYNGGIDPGNNKVRVPDKRGRVPMGADNMGSGAAGRVSSSNARGQNGGEERHALSSSENAAHAHGVTDPGHKHGILVDNGAGVSPNVVALAQNRTGLVDNGYSATVGTGVSIQSSGSGTSHNNLQPYEVDNVIVRVA